MSDTYEYTFANPQTLFNLAEIYNKEHEDEDTGIKVINILKEEEEYHDFQLIINMEKFESLPSALDIICRGEKVPVDCLLFAQIIQGTIRKGVATICHNNKSAANFKGLHLLVCDDPEIHDLLQKTSFDGKSQWLCQLTDKIYMGMTKYGPQALDIPTWKSRFLENLNSWLESSSKHTSKSPSVMELKEKIVKVEIRAYQRTKELTCTLLST